MTAASRALAIGCVALATSACNGTVGGHESDAGAPSRGGAAGTSLGPGAGGTGGAAGADGAAGASGPSGGAGSSGGAAAASGGGAGGLAGTAGAAGSTGAAGAIGVSGTAGNPSRGGTSGSAGTTGSGGTSGSAGTTGAAGSGGTAGSAGTAGAPGDPAGWVPALIGVGYGGIRIVSRDGGKTWGDRAYETTNGGDDDVLLRAVTYGKGIWVATGWKLWTSTDGVHWTDHGKLQDGLVKSCAIIEGLAYKDGAFFGVCDGNVFRSSDGLTWTKVSNIGNTGSHVSLVYRDGKFVAYGDTKTSFQSDDALTWTTMAGIQEATYCENTWKSQTDCDDSSWFDGTYLRADWQGKISRSTDGKTFTTVYNDDQKNTLYQSRAIAAGMVAPK
jgi:hypothetical protein